MHEFGVWPIATGIGKTAKMRMPRSFLALFEVALAIPIAQRVLLLSTPDSRSPGDGPERLHYFACLTCHTSTRLSRSLGERAKCPTNAEHGSLTDLGPV